MVIFEELLDGLHTELFWVLALGHHFNAIWDPFISMEADYSAIDGI